MDASYIHLGYEIGTGEPVSVPLQHLAVTGQTQRSGKTTTLEALISRSKLRALTFVTKRAEGAFQHAHQIRPYFRERADWQYVSAILETTLREKLKFERSWIVKVCRGAQSLDDVQRNIERDLQRARGLNESVLTTLHAYLEPVLPQIAAISFAPKIELARGINVMDLSGFRLELQSLIIRSALEWVYEREDNTVVIIPEAWELIPQNRASPVKLGCEQLIRKGGALRNYVWLDSQDLASVHKDILRSVSVWILGVQRERNEVSRMLEHIVGAAKPGVSEVMELGVGEFFVSFAKQLHRVYVQPAWMDARDAQNHARGGPLVTKAAAKQEGDPQEERMWKEKYEALKAEFDQLKREMESLRESRADANHGEAARVPAGEGNGPVDLESIYGYIRSRLLKESDPGVIEVLARRPELRVKVDRPILQLDESTLRGRLARLITDGFFDEPATGSAAFSELKRRGVSTSKPNVYKELDRLAEMGIVTKEREGYQKAAGAIVKSASA